MIYLVGEKEEIAERRRVGQPLIAGVTRRNAKIEERIFNDTRRVANERLGYLLATWFSITKAACITISITLYKSM